MAHQHFDEYSIKKYTLTAFLAFVCVFFFLMLMMRCHGDFSMTGNEAHGAAAHKGHHEEATAEKHEDAATAKESVHVMLPNGKELNAYKGGIEDMLVVFLNDSSSKAGKDVWFDFDNLNFKTGSAEITEESQLQVSNISEILKAYPKLKIKIGGYTDKTGDSLTNLALSNNRAKVVADALAKLNSSGQVTGAEGYGSQFAKAAADAPDAERAKDRRISVSVREK